MENFWQGKWFSSFPATSTDSDGTTVSRQLPHPSREQALACIAMLESGGIDIDPNQMKRVIAISAGNSIFVAAKLLSDPARDLPASTTKRIVGNIGSAGLSLLVAPENLRIRPESNDLRAVQHIDYDYKRQNSFEGTSLHLFIHWMEGSTRFGDPGFH